jgi:signal peptidase II
MTRAFSQPIAALGTRARAAGCSSPDRRRDDASLYTGARLRSYAFARRTKLLLFRHAAHYEVSLVGRCQNPRVIALIAVAVVLGLDQLSKQWALTALRQVDRTVVLPGPVDLTLMFNRSNAFGLVAVSGALTRWALAALNLAIAAILARVVVRHSMSRASTAGLAFIIAGAIGNALDRIRFGAVIDFLNASKLGFVWVFNVADASIDVGIALLLFAALLARPGSDDVSGIADDRAK